MSPFNQAPPGVPTASALLDPKGLSLLAGYLLRAVLRRKLIALVAFLATVGLTLAAAAFMPRTYRVETRILTNNTDLEEIVNPMRFQSNEAMTKNVVERFLARENMVGVITDSELLKRWDEDRSTVGKMKDAVRAFLFEPVTEKDKIEALLEITKKKLQVYVDGDIVVFRVEWHDPGTTLKIAEVAQARFLDLQRKKELAQKRESVAILERNVENSKKDLESRYQELEKAIQQKGASAAQVKAVRARRASSSGGGGGGGANHAEIERLRDLAAEKKAVIGDIERVWRSTVVQAQAALAKARETLGPEHPDLQQAARVVEQESRPPPELTKLKTEVAQIQGQIERLESRIEGPKERKTVAEEVLAVAEGPKDIKDDPEVERMMTNITVQENAHFELLERLSAARIEVETAEVAFAYRYITVYPPLYPKRAVSPNVPALIMAGVIVALFLAFLLAVAADVLSMRIMESWMIERFLGLPVLGEIAPR